MTPLFSLVPDKPQESCGVFALYAPGAEVARIAYFGLYALQHRGQESAGIATIDQQTLHIHKDDGLVSQVFKEKILAEGLPGQIAIGHTRYSPSGSNQFSNAQPIVVETRLGPLALAHNGNLLNANVLREQLIEKNYLPKTTTDAELIALTIATEVDAGKDWAQAASNTCQQLQGAFSLTMGTPDGILATRDTYGIRPLVLGSLPPSGQSVVPDVTNYVLASESCALDIMGAKYIRDVEPGELIWVNEDGLIPFQWSIPNHKLCVFEMIYFSRPDSKIYGESLSKYRQRLGQQLARESPVDADLVIGIPDSGIPAAIGFSEESKIPYALGLIKNRYVDHTIIQPTRSMQASGIQLKLNPLKEVLTGKRVVVIDDSIMTGTTTSQLVKAIRNVGASEVHMRISSPPVTHPCFFGIEILDNQTQLIASTLSVEEISNHIGVDSLAYLSWAKMLDSTRGERHSFCSACFTGKYPIVIPEKIE